MEALIALLKMDDGSEVKLNVIKVNTLASVRLLTVKVCAPVTQAHPLEMNSLTGTPP